ncbi:carbohydrate kinase family protein [Pengzhenrongella sicca]|uniref:Carbohydrate kinase family protein n=1 Tax=Pengzhenrongella sicca TaxID=2819238 RepID=A0A8A4Z8I6_9MICO|nr:carbohydrate kinase family protein [Pengzhenrongella sicca]QTE27785.1 carbohydrate kinase family protein [Pengzhenrongella sicca]
MPSVLVAGPVSWNAIVTVAALPEPRSQTLFASDHRDTLGGTSAGKALALARLGVDVALHTVLGDDDAGTRVRAELAEPRLRLEATVVPGPTERHLNLMAAGGERVSIYLDVPRAPDEVPASAAADLARCEVAVVDLSDASRRYLDLARTAGVPVWCDLHDYDGHAAFHRDFLAAADVVVVSADRLADPRAFLTDAVAAGARWAVCTRGARGALALGRTEGWLEVPATTATWVVDTNGAGDAFVAGMLLGHLERRPLAHCLRLGAAAGALAVASAALVSTDLTADAVRRIAGLASDTGADQPE